MASTSISGVPVGASTTAGFVAEPPTVSITVPGSSAMPTALYSHGPSRAAIASWEKVSALESRVGNPITPLSLERTLRPGGMCASPLMPRTSAPPSPEMNRCGTVTIRVGHGIRRSAKAAVIELCPKPSSAMPITISSASSAAAASAAPSRIRCGPRVRIALSFHEGGSPSVPFTTMTGGQVLATAGVHHSADLAGEREPRAASAAQLDPVGEADQLARGERREAAVHLLVGDEIQATVLVEARGDPRDADRRDRWNLSSAQLASPRSCDQYRSSATSSFAHPRSPRRAPRPA